jgi:hypothetical protein
VDCRCQGEGSVCVLGRVNETSECKRGLGAFFVNSSEQLLVVLNIIRGVRIANILVLAPLFLGFRSFVLGMDAP